MPRYYFNVLDGRSSPDEVGSVLGGPDDTRRKGIRLAGAIIDEHAPDIVLDSSWHLEVRDESGALVTRLDVVVDAPAKAA
ncbi:hypothetical protein PUR29_29960 [Methylobacterium ajmalii]|uniref:DUF6894 domain-containing protein n=1 Tax=Methylobacterium ajmalii TaxID=2738439 RepID=A0ABV0A1N1_9HYPH